MNNSPEFHMVVQWHFSGKVGKFIADYSRKFPQDSVHQKLLKLANFW